MESFQNNRKEVCDVILLPLASAGSPEDVPPLKSQLFRRNPSICGQAASHGASRVEKTVAGGGRASFRAKTEKETVHSCDRNLRPGLQDPRYPSKSEDDAPSGRKR